jgi:hypothetical protein
VLRVLVGSAARALALLLLFVWDIVFLKVEGLWTVKVYRNDLQVFLKNRDLKGRLKDNLRVLKSARVQIEKVEPGSGGFLATRREMLEEFPQEAQTQVWKQVICN